MKQIEFQIMEQSYVLGCPDGGEDKLSQTVARVDQAMLKIRDSGKLRSRERIAVLAALNLAFEHIEAEEKYQQAAAIHLQPEEEQHLQDLLSRMDVALAHKDKQGA